MPNVHPLRPLGDLFTLHMILTATLVWEKEGLED